MTDLCRKLLFFFLSLCSVFSGGAQEVPFVCADRLCGKETRQPRRCKEKGGRKRGRELPPPLCNPLQGKERGIKRKQGRKEREKAGGRKRECREKGRHIYNREE